MSDTLKHPRPPVIGGGWVPVVPDDWRLLSPARACPSLAYVRTSLDRLTSHGAKGNRFTAIAVCMDYAAIQGIPGIITLVIEQNNSFVQLATIKNVVLPMLSRLCIISTVRFQRVCAL